MSQTKKNPLASPGVSRKNSISLIDVLEAIQKGRNTWERWYTRLSRFSEKAFGENWKKDEKDLLDKFTFHT
ncbi:MAG: hypothetical protein JRE21_08450 [Deltaproteobacteria bacterium]|nr:hypothetical protein [Deltaproteobacteria bacterium]